MTGGYIREPYARIDYIPHTGTKNLATEHLFRNVSKLARTTDRKEPNWTSGQKFTSWTDNKAHQNSGSSYRHLIKTHLKSEKLIWPYVVNSYLYCRLVVFLLQIFANLCKGREAAPARLQLAAAGYPVAAALQQHQLSDRLIREKTINVVVKLPEELSALGRINYKDPDPKCWLFLKIDLLMDFAAFCLTDFIDCGDTFTHGWYFRPSLRTVAPMDEGTILVYCCLSTF